MEYVLNKNIDCTGLFCPLPIIKTKRAIREIEVGQILEMIATDADVVRDLESWSIQTQQQILFSEKDANGVYRFLIRKEH